MTLSEMLLSEFDEEMASTRKILACVPDGRFDWKPHSKSFTLGRLASHLAELPLFAVALLKGMAKKAADPTSGAELLQTWDERVAAARVAIAAASDAHLSETVAVSTPFEATRLVLYRRRVLSHLIHHRGQLSVYLRLLDTDVPGMYGPSADDKSASQS